jgi:signal transduction histidine kinase
MTSDERAAPVALLPAEPRSTALLDERRSRLQAELANARLLLLVNGSKQIAGTTSPTETLDALARMVIPTLADWSYVVHRGWDGQRVVVPAHGDPTKARLLSVLRDCVPDANAPEGPSCVFRTGQPQICSELGGRDFVPGDRGTTIVGAADADRAHGLSALGMSSLLCVPISGRTGVDGVLTLVCEADARRYGPDEVLVAGELASRAAITLESGRLLFEALQGVRARDDFLAVAAHELRTPLTSLMLHAHSAHRTIARECPGAASAAQSVGGIQTQATRLSKLIDGLLDAVRLESNRMTLQFGDVDLRELVDGVLGEMADDFQRAGCHLTASTPEGVTVRWDRFRMGQVLTNLLTNATKFGTGRPIEVRVEAHPRNVRMSVRDHGPGIPREDQARIFGRFERAVSTSHFGGMGLGLYISAQILRMHQGSLRVESEPGYGACFIVDVPRGVGPPLPG